MTRRRSTTGRLTIGHIARELGISPATVRGWERRGLVPAAGRDWRGARIFRPADLERLRVLAGLAEPPVER